MAPRIARRPLLAALAAAPFIAGPAAARLIGRQRFAALEAKSGGRLGVAIVDTGSGARAGWRIDERFPMCSTCKLVAVAALLSKVDHGHDRLDREIVVDAALVGEAGHAPVTRPKMFQTLPLMTLAEAAIVDSDNGALNLIVTDLGGPAAVTDFAREIKDDTTRLDRLEPDLNTGIAGDLRDTTSPIAMLETLRRLVLGGVLRDESRTLLTGWLTASTTGTHRLRAGLPGCRVADKTGSADTARIANDIAVAWRPGGAPVVITAYLVGSPLNAAGRDAVIAAVGRIAADI